MATFVPNEIILAKDLTKKITNKFNAILLFLDISGFSILYNKYTNAENGGMYAYTMLLNKYLNVIVEEIYSTGGDILKFSQNAILSLWRIYQDELMINVIPKVISCALRLQKLLANIDRTEKIMSKINALISAGNVIFGIIGNELSRHYIITGQPILDLRKAKKVCLPGDLVLSMNAWEHCTPSQYKYVIKDEYNIKIIKVIQDDRRLVRTSTSIRPLISSVSKRWNRKIMRRLTELLQKKIIITREEESSSTSDENTDDKIFSARKLMVEEMKRNMAIQLKIYLIHAVAEQITHDLPLEHLMETRRITMVSIDIKSTDCSDFELIYLVDECYLLLHGIIKPNSGCIYSMNLYDNDISFSIVFGLEESNENVDDNNEEITKNAIVCAYKILQALKIQCFIRGTSIGVSTGVAYCGVVGHNSRKDYMITGIPVNNAKSIMEISYDKVCCDYDTVMHSNLCRNAFRSRGVQNLKISGKCHVYEFLGIPSIQPTPINTSNINYRYPILGRFQELETFNDILDNIGVMDRNNSGLLIMGNERSGKSRLLDAYVTIAKNRQINVIQLPLHYSYSEKEYTVIYHILLLILEAEDCKSIKDRERVLKKKLGSFLFSTEFCYLNTLMKVSFPLSNEYCASNSWQRYIKMTQIFNIILNQSGKMCIFLDDFHYTDLMSWQFISLALNNVNVVIVITTLNPSLNIAKFDIEDIIFEDKRLIKRTLQGLDNQFLTAFACQFLNVVAIPKSLDVILKKYSQNNIGWCELYLSLTLQSNGLDFLTMTATELKKYNLVFPESSMITKVPSNLLPEDVIPSSELNTFHVCITNELYIGFLDANLSYIGLKKKLYERMNSYQQEFIKCAASLGRLFVRTIVQTVMLNSTAVYTAKTVSELIRIRIIECASIQRTLFYTDDHLYGLFIRRQTFSNMHHLIQCDCPLSHDFSIPTLPAYSNCKMLEFKILSFHKMLYDMLQQDKKDEYWQRACQIYERETQKCSECGGGSFFRIFSRKLSVEIPSTMSLVRREPTQSILKTNIQQPIRTDILRTQRIPIMPFFDNDQEDEQPVEDFSSDVISVSSKIGFLFDRSRSKFLRRSSVTPQRITDPSRYIFLKKFTSIDYRNCHCYDKVNYIFWKLSEYIEQIGSDEDILEFLIGYSAGLIYIAEPLFALKILEMAEEVNKNIEKECQQKETCNKYPIINKSMIFMLLGDAHMALGNYCQAKITYTKAISSRMRIPRSKLAICYITFKEKLYLRIRIRFLNHFMNRYQGPTAFDNLQLASFLQRISSVLMIEKKTKAAQSFILQSLRLGIESSGNFSKQAEIYLTAVKVLRHTGDFNFIKRLEYLMMEVIKTKIYWYYAEDLRLMTKIFMAMYEIRALRGEFQEAIKFGRKILRITNTMKLTHGKLALLPSFIEIMMWTKHISEAIDLINELYYLSDEDIDSSAITWYYALSLEFLLQAGIFLESYESCLRHAKTLANCKTKGCVSRDPECLTRLLSGLWIWQLRMGYRIDESFELTVDIYTKRVQHDIFSTIITCGQGLECFLLVLIRCINLKKANQLIEILNAVQKIIKTLNRVSKRAPFIKPLLYFLKSHMNTIHGRKSKRNYNLHKAEKWSRLQDNKCMAAWILQNKRAMTIGNLGEYWMENVAYVYNIHWQDIHNFDLRSWASILYPLPIPNTYL
ncbi:PREDICTED: adenylate cyclase type 10-like [Polistes dominula]|uniref:Adenylate cyclase type 10-like n=1 Tax=Polistes dominula TaxID=743375 RepID=A0ABM1JEU8_POLDO|nr:PREDICTED: adenylate cyclase type 10-like [Polistes dominula]